MAWIIEVKPGWTADPASEDWAPVYDTNGTANEAASTFEVEADATALMNAVQFNIRSGIVGDYMLDRQIRKREL